MIQNLTNICIKLHISHFSCKSENISTTYPRGSTMPSLYREKMSDYRDEIDEELYLEKRLENHDFRMKRHYEKDVG